ncbi:Smg-4/UPF3 family-domain-containing protein [Chlamydoabsidia padenii]|nr:Smg-4/UPF3 family-domain-containing protein [Chlamydoabsidia padenii]
MAESSSSTTTATKPPSTPLTDAQDKNNKQKTLDKKKKRQRRKKKAKRVKKNEPKTKVVVRRLPPNLPEQVFMNAVQQWTTNDVVDFSMFIPVDAVIAFHQGFDGHIFMDKSGNESRAVVEFAPYQGIPKEHKTPDTRQGTIDDDADYLQFLESLKAEQTKPTEATDLTDNGTQIERLENKLALVAAQTLAQEQANKPKTTPLLEHLRAQKAAKSAKKKAAAKTTSTKKKPATTDKPTTDGPEEKKRNRRRKKDKSKGETSGDTPTDKKSNKPPTEKKEGKPKRSRNKDKKQQPKSDTTTPAIKILGRQEGTTKAT